MNPREIEILKNIISESLKKWKLSFLKNHLLGGKRCFEEMNNESLNIFLENWNKSEKVGASLESVFYNIWIEKKTKGAGNNLMSEVYKVDEGKVSNEELKNLIKKIEQIKLNDPEAGEVKEIFIASIKKESLREKFS